MRNLFFFLVLSGCSGDFSSGAARLTEKIDAGNGGFSGEKYIEAGTGGHSGGPLTLASGGKTPNSGGFSGHQTVHSGGEPGSVTRDATPPDAVTQPSDALPTPHDATAPPPDATAPPPDAAPCAGCTLPDGSCHPGDERTACGLPGGACEDCSAAPVLLDPPDSTAYCAPGLSAAFDRKCSVGYCRKASLACCTRIGHCA